MVRTQCFHHHALGSIPAQRTKNSQVEWCRQKKKKKHHFFFFNYWISVLTEQIFWEHLLGLLITCQWAQDDLRQQCFLVWWLAGAVGMRRPFSSMRPLPREAHGSCMVVAAPRGRFPYASTYQAFAHISLDKASLVTTSSTSVAFNKCFTPWLWLDTIYKIMHRNVGRVNNKEWWNIYELAMAGRILKGQERTITSTQQ